MPLTILITGGCGFIGSAVVRFLVRQTEHRIINLDRMTYAASEEALEHARNHPRHTLVRADIADASAVSQIFATHQPDAVMHLAAESHVDRSIDGPGEFVRPMWSAPSSCSMPHANTTPRFHPTAATPSASTTSPPTRCSGRSAVTIPVYRNDALRSAQPLFGQQGSVGSPRACLAPHLWRADDR